MHEIICGVMARHLLQLLLGAKLVSMTALLLTAVFGAWGKASIAPVMVSTQPFVMFCDCHFCDVDADCLRF